MADFATLHEIVAAARGNLSDGAWDYLTGGAETETSLLRNRLGLDSIAFRPRVLNDVSAIDLSGTIAGHAVRLPVSLAPMGSLELLHPDGSMAVARAAEAFGTVSYLSSVTHPGLEAVAKGTGHPKVYQLYVRGGRDSVAEVAKQAMSAGYTAFCLTVDVAVYSRRERDLIKRYVPTARRSASGEGMEYQARLDWDLVKWFKDSFDIPLQIKGVATAEDAALCIEHGVDTVYVSNHGGRQLDHGRATIDMLPEVVEAVGGQAEIVVDGGFMRGADIVKAIARGADSVAIGKLQGFGLAAAGMTGIVRVLELLEEEMRISMGLMGLTRLDRLDGSFLHPAPPVREPSVLSAFPFLTLRSPEY
ncbi:MAG: alpha-hydroxy acid oxidase [Defluviicoccus sp.]|nr:alpha-hydroxy acid oxidase [Defluviicoccus sp.]MDE0385480.1 alpha-hydroxy acid oxidase [Defluviicoccus sp.]